MYDISKVAIQTLQKDFGALTARRMGGVAAKAVVADQFRQKNELVGTLAWVLMNAADRADLRQWSTLPESIQLIRVFLKPGKYRFDLKGIDYSGQETEALQTQQNEIEIKSGQKTFLSWRAIK